MVNMRITPAISKGTERSIMTRLDEMQPTSMRKRNKYSNTNANLFFALLIYFFMQIHSFAKLEFCETGLGPLLEGAGKNL